MNNKISIDRVIVDNVGAVDTFSDSLKKIVNAKATPEMIERMQGLDLLFGVNLDNIKEISERYGLTYHSENIKTIK